MTFGPLDLSNRPPGGGRVLTIGSQIESSEYFDKLLLEVSKDGQNWAGWRWTGHLYVSCGGWCESLADLTEVGSSAPVRRAPMSWMRFGFFSDADIPFESTYLDDISVQALVEGGQPSPTPTRTHGEPSRTPTPTRRSARPVAARSTCL